MKRLLVLSIFLTGCAGSAVDICGSSPEKIQTYSDRQLAEIHGLPSFTRGCERVRDELRRRGLFDEAEWRQINSREVQPGMKGLAVLASIGIPLDEISEQRGDGLVQKWTFAWGYFSRMKVEVFNGVVERVER